MSSEGDDEMLTVLLQAAGQGDSNAQQVVAAQVYNDLHRLAQSLMKQEPNQTLQPTALVHQAFMRLFNEASGFDSPDRAYFFAAAAQAMHRLLVEAARRRQAQKRGGDRSRELIDDFVQEAGVDYDRILDLDQALTELEGLQPRQAKVVQMRWFAQYTVPQVAELLKVSESTVEQDWRVARAFLKHRLGD